MYSFWITGQRFPQTTNPFIEWAVNPFFNYNSLSWGTAIINKQKIKVGRHQVKVKHQKAVFWGGFLIFFYWWSVRYGLYNNTEPYLFEKNLARDKRNIWEKRDRQWMLSVLTQLSF